MTEEIEEAFASLSAKQTPCIVCGEEEQIAKACSRECYKEYMKNPDKYNDN